MNKKKLIITIGLVNLGLAFAVVGAQAGLRGEFLSQIAKGDDAPQTYSLTLNNSKTPSGLTSSFQDNVSGSVTTSLGNSISMNFVKAKATSGNFVTLGSRGMIYTFGSEQGGISGICAVTAVFSGSILNVRTSQTDILVNGGATTTGPQGLESGVRKEITPARYISFISGEGENNIESITLEYTCSTSEDIKRINGTYTGTGGDGYNYSLTFNNGVATMTSINKETATSYTGTATWSGSTVTCSFTSPEVVYNFTLSNDAYQLTYVSKSGNDAASAPQITFYRVYDIDTFETYAGDGIGWDMTNQNGSNKYNVTGFKSGYICEYNSGNSSKTGPVSGQTGWELMQTDSYMSVGSAGHNGNKSGLYKCRDVKLSFYHMKGYFGIPSVIGRGTKLSVWAKGPYTNTSLSTQSSQGANFTFSLYYTAQVNGQTINQCTKKDFRAPAGNNWEEFTMDLDSSKSYFAYSITTFSSNTGDTERYLPIDDIKIYTVSPDAPTAYATPSGNFHGYGNRSGTQDGIFLSLGSNGEAKVTVAGTHYTVTSYSVSDNAITIKTSGNTKIQTITATYNPSNNTITQFKASGNLGSDWSNNGSITLSQPDLTWNCDEQTFEMREIFVRRYKQPGANPDSDFNYHDDNIDSDNTNYVSGGHSLRLRPYEGGKGLGIKLVNDLSPVSAQNCNFWVYNPTSSQITLSLWVYYMDGQTLKNKLSYNDNIECASGWTYHACGFGATSNVVNFQLGMFPSSGTLPNAALQFDNITIY